MQFSDSLHHLNMYCRFMNNQLCLNAALAILLVQDTQHELPFVQVVFLCLEKKNPAISFELLL